MLNQGPGSITCRPLAKEQPDIPALFGWVQLGTRALSQYKDGLSRCGDSHVKVETGETVISLIRGIPILVGRHLYVELAPASYQCGKGCLCGLRPRLWKPSPTPSTFYPVLEVCRLSTRTRIVNVTELSPRCTDNVKAIAVFARLMAAGSHKPAVEKWNKGAIMILIALSMVMMLLGCKEGSAGGR